MVSLILAKSQVSNFKADSTNNGNINYIVYQHNVHTERTNSIPSGEWQSQKIPSNWEKHLQSATTTKKLRNKNGEKIQSSESAKHKNQIKTKKKITKTAVFLECI